MKPFAPAQPAAIEITVCDGIDPAATDVALIAPPRHRFLDAAWYRAAAAPGSRPRTIVVRDAAGTGQVALPIARGRGGIQEVIGHYWPFRSFTIAGAASAGALEALLADRAARAALGIAWRIGPLPEDDPALAALRRAAPMAGWRIAERRIATTHILDMGALAADGGWPRGSTLRKNRFHEKHLAQHGGLDWRHVTGADWSPAILDDLASIEAKSWHAGSRDAKFLAPANRAHWQALIADPAAAARLHAAILYVAGVPIAFSFDLDCGDTRYAIANSYDPAFAKHSPGKCLQYRSLVRAMAAGITRVDWGAGDSGYKATIGAEAGPDLIDCLVMRAVIPGPIRALATALWRRSARV
ncbi:GNAT family N-acetyltransferase [Sphingomonas sp. 1P06PA]|uniref:GNAT family N-acetyltransferase n=1 Tax=Sphingomonas sp. 1P06PA TaxID=554121 RepID=UPI0039A6B1CB